MKFLDGWDVWLAEHVSGAKNGAKRSRQKIGWSGAERWADIPENTWAEAEHGAGDRGPERMESANGRSKSVHMHLTSKIIDINVKNLSV